MSIGSDESVIPNSFWNPPYDGFKWIPACAGMTTVIVSERKGPTMSFQTCFGIHLTMGPNEFLLSQE